MFRKLFFYVSPVLISFGLNAQSSSSNMSGGKCSNCIQPLDGNHTLGFLYQKDTCGLNYKAAYLKIGQRFSPPGAIQPVTLTISGLPPCMLVEKAFLWCDASGTGIPITATVVNPAAASANFPMTIIGQDVDKCWGYAGTYSYRADITSAISGNGNYVFSGFPVGPPDDVDGIAMMIIYRDPTSTAEGHIIIYDGAVEITASTTTQTILNLAACQNSSSANAFMIVADLQSVGTTESMNNSPAFSITDDWWNYVDQPTSQITTGQTTSDFTITTGSDCFNFMMMGLYYQTTTCNVCTANATIVLNVNATSSGGCGASTGSVSATASGGQGPYTYNWQPGNYSTSTVNNLTAGTYTCTVTDASGCGAGADTVTVTTGNFPIAQFSVTPSPVAFFPGQVCVTDQTVGGANWIWSVNGIPSDTNSTFCYTLPDTGSYCFGLIVQNAAGCADTALSCVTVLGESTISVPNVFTPNGDGSNDAFVVTWIGLTSLSCDIYDRWGVLIYSWNGLTGSWDGRTTSGKKATDGVYYYVVNATTTQGAQKTLTGFVQLIRGK
jgi:gliding motility-associated-like protein